MDFTLQTNSTHGSLSGDDLTFFYYDIGQDYLQGWPKCYDWNIVVLKYKDIIDVQECDKKDIPADFNDNVIRFSVSNSIQSDNGNVACAFFRHLRNAFSHYRIVRRNEWYDITDCNDNGEITMRGRVKVDLLKEFCFCFFDKREEIINTLDNSSIDA